MTSQKVIYVVAWNGDPAENIAVLRAMYPDCEIRAVDKRTLTNNNMAGQIRALRQLRGEALIFSFRSLDDLTSPLLLASVGLFHRCAATVLLDSAGNKKQYGRLSWLRLAPALCLGLILDSISLVRSLVLLKTGLHRRRSLPALDSISGNEIAYFFPMPLTRLDFGGAASHVRGFLSGLRQAGAQCRVYSSGPLAQTDFVEEHVAASKRPFFFWEAMTIAYNWRFARRVRDSFNRQHHRAIYQRHGRFTVAGALVSRTLQVPLVLEYNGSEVWAALNWQPVHFDYWVRLCEDYVLAFASLIVVVSEPLRQELIARGIPEERILVNPNAVDPTVFQPGTGGSAVRRQLGLAPDEVVVCFVGTFSYWHGMNVMQEAIDRLLRMAEEEGLGKLRFLLIGDGPLRAEVAAHLDPWVVKGQVIFSGVVPHDRIPGFLDAADIFLSPQIPFADGSEFFGSPTKLFEYMAMERATVVSNLGQMGQMIRHGENGWLVTPGSVEELVDAVAYLVAHPEVRLRLGKQAREAVIMYHTWRQNALSVLDALRFPRELEPAECDSEILRTTK